MAKKSKPFSAVIFFIILLTAVFFLDQKKPEAPSEEISRAIDITGRTQKVKVFLIRLNDNGLSGKAVGCGDSAVAFEREIAPTTAVLKASLEELLLLKEETYQERDLYNALAGTKLRLDTVSINETGKARIQLSGSYSFSGVCEDARFIAQIEETARQFLSVREVEIFLNGRNLENLYSGN